MLKSDSTVQTENSPIIEDGDIEAEIYFLSSDELYNTVKPYRLRYQPEDTNIPRTNIILERQKVKIHNMRNQIDQMSYDICGFSIMQMASQMVYEDFADPDKIKNIHLREICESVQAMMKASSVHVLAYEIRRRDPAFPTAGADTYQFLQPIMKVHIDYTYNDIMNDKLSKYHKADSGSKSQPRWQALNVWHPLRGPLRDWPLALCDASSVDFEKDSKAGDLIDREGGSENIQIQYSPQQKWYYLRDQSPAELLIFKNADSNSPSGATPGVPHSSFVNPNSTPLDLLRESIECRLLVLWET